MDIFLFFCRETKTCVRFCLLGGGSHHMFMMIIYERKMTLDITYRCETNNPKVHKNPPALTVEVINSKTEDKAVFCVV